MVAASREVAVAKGWRRSCMDRRMQKVEDDSKVVAEALQCWRQREEDLRVSAAVVMDELLRLRDVMAEVDYQTGTMQHYMDELVMSSRKREQAEGMALRGHDGCSSLLPVPWWRHACTQT